MDSSIPKSIILLIGNGKYSDPEIPPLPNVYANISQLNEFFNNRSLYECIGASVVETCLDLKAFEIHKRVEKLCASMAFDTRIIIYYTGHGLPSTNTGKYFLASQDSEKDYVDSTAIDIDKIILPLKKCKSQQKIFIVDACYSGKIHDSLSLTKDAIYSDIVEPAAGIYVASSTNSSREAKFDSGNPKMPTYFTHFLLQTLKGGIHIPDNEAEPSPKKYLTINEVFQQVDFELSQNNFSRPVKTIRGNADRFFFCANKKYLDYVAQRTEKPVSPARIAPSPSQPAPTITGKAKNEFREKAIALFKESISNNITIINDRIIRIPVTNGQRITNYLASIFLFGICIWLSNDLYPFTFEHFSTLISGFNSKDPEVPSWIGWLCISILFCLATVALVGGLQLLFARLRNEIDLEYQSIIVGTKTIWLRSIHKLTIVTSIDSLVYKIIYKDNGKERSEELKINKRSNSNHPESFFITLFQFYSISSEIYCDKVLIKPN